MSGGTTFGGDNIHYYTGTISCFSGTPGHAYEFRDNPGNSGTVGKYVLVTF